MRHSEALTCILKRLHSFWMVVKGYRRFLDFLWHSWGSLRRFCKTFSWVPSMFWNNPEGSEAFSDRLECLRYSVAYSDVLRCDETFWSTHMHSEALTFVLNGCERIPKVLRLSLTFFGWSEAFRGIRMRFEWLWKFAEGSEKFCNTLECRFWGILWRSGVSYCVLTLLGSSKAFSWVLKGSWKF